jgi:RHS repeat-associated protein
VAKTYLFWDPLSDNILQERDETGAVTAEYTAEPGLYGNVISQNRGGVESQFHYDAQGSTLAVTDDNQNVIDTFAYTAFGEVTERTGTTEVPFQYIGQKGYYRDSLTGQCSVRRRAYEPMRARWLSFDPLGVLQRFPNAYAYAANRTLMFLDPSGLVFICAGSGGNFSTFVGIPLKALNGAPVLGYGLAVGCSWFYCAGFSWKQGCSADLCFSCSLTLMAPGAGVWISVSGGPVFIFNPRTIKPSEGFSTPGGIGAGASLPQLYDIAGEVTIDYDLASGDWSFAIFPPKLGLGKGYYFSMRISGACTACEPGAVVKLVGCIVAATKQIGAILQGFVEGIEKIAGVEIIGDDGPNANGPVLELR